MRTLSFEVEPGLNLPAFELCFRSQREPRAVRRSSRSGSTGTKRLAAQKASRRGDRAPEERSCYSIREEWAKRPPRVSPAAAVLRSAATGEKRMSPCTSAGRFSASAWPISSRSSKGSPPYRRSWPQRLPRVGVGAAGPVVLHAALLDEHGLIKKVTLERRSYRGPTSSSGDVSRNQMGNVVPGVLEAYDLPDLAARLAPLPLTIDAPVDAMGEPVSQAALERSYARCAESYGASGKLVSESDSRLEPEPLTEVDELVVECVATELGVEDRRRVDELGGLFGLPVWK